MRRRQWKRREEKKVKVSTDHHRASKGYSTFETEKHDKALFNRDFLPIMANLQQNSEWFGLDRRISEKSGPPIRTADGRWSRYSIRHICAVQLTRARCW